MKHFRSPLLALVLCTVGTAFARYDDDLSEAERLAMESAMLRPWHMTVGAGTGDLYGGLYGASAELGIWQISLVAAGGFDFARYTFSRYPLEDMENGVPHDDFDHEFVWRAGLKGYLAGEEMKFRPFLAALAGPLMTFDYEWDGERRSGTYLSFGGATGFDYDFGAPRGFVATVGISAFLLTHSISKTDADRIQAVKNDEVGFIYPKLVGGLNYRF